MVRQQVGWILFDSARDEPPMVPGGPALSDRALVFQFDEVTVDLVVLRKPPGAFSLHGQVIRKQALAPLAGARVRVVDSESTEETDERGRFRLDLSHPEEPHMLEIETAEVNMICRIPATCESGLP